MMSRSHSDDAVCPMCRQATLPESVGRTGREKALAAVLTAQELLADDDSALQPELKATVGAFAAEMGQEAVERVREALAGTQEPSEGDQELDRLRELPE